MAPPRKKCIQQKMDPFHAANDAEKELRGCIAPVKKLTGEGKGLYSQRALDLLMINIRSLKRKNEQLKLIIKKASHETKRQIKETDTKVL